MKDLIGVILIVFHIPMVLFSLYFTLHSYISGSVHVEAGTWYNWQQCMYFLPFISTVPPKICDVDGGNAWF